MAHPDGTREHFSYDESGNLCRYTDPNGASTEYRYNEQHQLIQRIDANRHALRYRYNRHRQLVQLINQNGETYDFRYDAAGRLIREIGFDGQETTYEYDPAGHVVARERGGLRTEYRRDPLGRLLQKSTPQGATHYAYDTLARLVRAHNEHARLNFEYDALGRLVTEEQHVAVPTGSDTRRVSFTLEHEYDALGNRTQTRLPNGREVVTQRYGSGHWHGVLWNGQAIVDVERDALHRETDRELGRGRERLNQSRDYDPLSRIKQLSLRRGNDTLAQRRFDYDAAGQLLEVRDQHRGTLSYRYDPVGQLLEAVQPGLKERFAFDPAGNLIEPGQGNAEKKLAPLQHNLLKKYLQQRYEHDERGNTVRKVRKGGPDEQPYTLALHYDDENRLVQAERPVDGGRLQAEYYYDAFGRRVAKRVRTLSAVKAAGTDHVVAQPVLDETLTLFVWDGDTLIQEVTDTGTATHLYEPERFVPLAQIHSDTPLAGYQTGPRGLSPTEPNRHQALKAAAATDRIYFVATDHLGTPQELVDEAGGIAWQARYRAWGREVSDDGADIRQPLRFQGQYEDEETGLYYNRHRYYDPDSGRYITPDPIGLLGGENAYQYAPNATGWVDPLGLCRNGVRDVPASHSLTNEETRVWYHQQLDQIPSRIDEDLPLRQQALQSFQMRNDVKLQARELMADRVAANALPPPKSLQDVARKAYRQGLSGDDVWLYVRDGATRSNSNVDAALGLTR